MDENIVASSQYQFNSSSKILKSLDELGSILAQSLLQNDSVIQLQEQNIALSVGNISPNNVNIIATESHKGYLKININSRANNQTKQLASFTTDNSTFKTNESNGIFSFVFRNSHLFQQRENMSQDNSQVKNLVETNVLAVAFVQEPSFGSQETIRLSFRKLKQLNMSEKKTGKCSFWDPTRGLRFFSVFSFYRVSYKIRH